MAKQTISIGTTANDHTGDTLRVAFDKVNDNFTELYDTTGADIQIPLQTGNDGKYLTTDGSTLSWATVNGGNANTGNVTFDDITVQGVYGLRLSPSPADTATGKYLQVRAGDNDSHIHFDSGDNSTYDLILGDDFKNVEVNHNGNVYIQSNSGSQWTFNTDGDTVLPDNGGLVFDRNNTSIRVGMGFHIASGEGISLDAIDQTDPENLVYKNWYFSPDGNMFLPNPGVIKNTEGSVNIVAPDYAQLQWTTPTGVTEADPNGTSELKNWIYVESGGIIAETNLNGPGIPFSWSFNTDGSVSIPYQSSNNRTGNGDVLMFAKHNAQQKIIGTQSGTVTYPTVERLVIAGGDSYTDGTTYSGEGGDIYLWAGYGADGGDIKVDAGNGVNSGGSVKIRGGNSVESGNGGFVEILSGYSSTGDGGNVTITASNAYANGGSVNIYSGTGNTSNGNVTITTPGHTWAFNAVGELTVPGPIKGDGLNLYGESTAESYAFITMPNNTNSATTPIHIANDNGNVHISTIDQGTATVSSWIFNNNGTLKVPGTVHNHSNFVIKSGMDSYAVEFIGYIDDTSGGPGATLHVTSIISGTITDGMTIYGAGLGVGGWTLQYGTVVEPQGSGGTGNYYLPGANFLISEQTFNDGISLTSHNWTFDNNGKTTLPGATILSTVEVNAGNNSGSIAIDLTKQVNKLHPWGSGGVVTGDQYTLADGVEGQIIHLVPHNSYNSGDEYTTVKLAHARYREMGTGNIVEVADASWWLPFGGNLTGSDQIGAYNALVTLIFTDGYWNLPHSIFD